MASRRYKGQITHDVHLLGRKGLEALESIVGNDGDNQDADSRFPTQVRNFILEKILKIGFSAYEGFVYAPDLNLPPQTATLLSKTISALSRQVTSADPGQKTDKVEYAQRAAICLDTIYMAVYPGSISTLIPVTQNYPSSEFVGEALQALVNNLYPGSGFIVTVIDPNRVENE